jgi:hypothetical protein
MKKLLILSIALIMGGCGVVWLKPALSPKDVGVLSIPDADLGPRWSGAEPILVLGEGKGRERVKLGEIAASWKGSILERLGNRRDGMAIKGVSGNGLEFLDPKREGDLERGALLLWRMTLRTRPALSGEIGRIVSFIRVKFRAIKVPEGKTVFKAEYEEVVPAETDGKRGRRKLEEIGRDIAGRVERDMFGKGLKIAGGISDEPIWKDGVRVIAVLPLAARRDLKLEQNPGWELFRMLGGSEEMLRKHGEDAIVEALRDAMRFYVIDPRSLKSMLKEELLENIDRISDISEELRKEGVDLAVMGWVSPGMGWFNITPMSSSQLTRVTAIKISPSIEMNISVLDTSSRKAVMSRTFEGVSGRGALPMGAETIVIGTRVEDEVVALLDGIREASLKASSEFAEALSSTRRRMER